MITIARKSLVDKLVKIEPNKVYPITFWGSTQIPALNGVLVKCYFQNLPEDFRIRLALATKKMGNVAWDWITVKEFNELKFLQIDFREIGQSYIDVWTSNNCPENIEDAFMWQYWGLY